MVGALLLLAIVIASDAWVYVDAKRLRDAGEPVVLVLGSLRVETPEAWLLACVVLWLVALPAYLVGRRH